MSGLLASASVLITLALVFYLWLMFAHAVWATRVVRTGSPAALARFHRFSLVVWTIWLVPYIGGMFLGMTG